jgi:hypothetical protein
MFTKRIAAEHAHIVDPEKGKIAQIFKKLGKSEATELELLRAAKDMGLQLTGLRTYCEIDANGLLRPKQWSE